MIPLNGSTPCEYANIELAIYSLLIVIGMVLVSAATDITRKYRDGTDNNKNPLRWLIVVCLLVVAIGLIAVSAWGLLSGGGDSTVNCLIRSFR